MSTADPSTADPSTADPSTADPSTADPSTADPGSPQQDFALDEVTTGSHAHGFGHVGDGREFAFRVRGSTVLLEVYRAESAPVFPVPEDVEATASRSVTGIDLDDRRGIEALVRDLAASVEPGSSTADTTVRAFLGRLGSVMDGW